MRRRPRIAALVLAALVPALTVLIASPASAGNVVQIARDFTFGYEGQPVTCTVRGYSEVDYDELGGVALYYQTTMVDDERRCKDAFVAVAAVMQYWRGEEGESEEALVDSYSTSANGVLRFSNTDLRDAVAHHTAYFSCDEEPVLGCQFSFDTDPFPFDSPK
jgi:hypothetical protein